MIFLSNDQKPNFFLSFPTMTIDEPEPSPFTDQIMEWFGGSFSYDPSPSFLHSTDDFFGESWWDQSQGQSLDLERTNKSDENGAISTSLNSLTSVTAAVELPAVLDNPAGQPLSRKRKAPAKEGEDGEAEVEQAAAPVRKQNGNRKLTTKPGGNSNNNNNNNPNNSKDGRWAEQLLNPCAAAITAGNINRVQHLLYVLSELASLTGDANHRLAAHGLQALTHHLGSASAFAGAANFGSTTTKFFRESLMIFNDINPWFRIPNSCANSSILQALTEMRDRNRSTLHILDIGVSHGIQWPTLLEELTHRPGGPPPLVRLTVVTPTVDNHHLMNTPFLTPPSGYDFSPNLLGFAKAINVNLQINMLDNFPLQNLNADAIKSSQDEILIVCAQFRLHNLSHHAPDERTELLKILRSLGPKRVVLSENNEDCSCSKCGDFANGFSRRVEYLWRFLDSTSMAFKGRWNEERRMMEGEAAKALINTGEMNERKEKWCERMRGVGFEREEFGEDAIDVARMLLRKYDNNWEMKVEERDGCVDLWWKGQPVSFTSLWKMMDSKASDDRFE